MQITFLGASGGVTGSKYLLEYKKKKILIDCGLFQGQKEVRQRNWDKFYIDPSDIDAIILTHAHIDHSGYIPRLVNNGFRGKIFCSNATFDLCKILLTDSGFLQEDDAERANRYGYTKHKPALPLYTEEDAENSLKFFHPIDFNQSNYFEDDFYFSLKPSGHILGAAFIDLHFGNENIVFSGDLGRINDPIMKTPTVLHHANYLLIESTYGNRLHEKNDPLEILKEVINKTAARGGVVVIPAFAVGRAQNIMFYLYQLKQQNAIPDIPIFLDSPMAIDASEILYKYSDEHKLGKKLTSDVCKIARYVRSKDESKALNLIKMPMIIISASGMAEGGRVLHHLKNYITDHKNTILFSGFLVQGTRGDKILRGAREIKIHGGFYEVKAEIVNLGNSSAHADYEEILAWLGNFKKAPQKTFITHGNAEAAAALKEKIEKKFSWQVVIPQYLDCEKLQ
jgi:metallo-beta-lactamase family protein